MADLCSLLFEDTAPTSSQHRSIPAIAPTSPASTIPATFESDERDEPDDEKTSFFDDYINDVIGKYGDMTTQTLSDDKFGKCIEEHPEIDRLNEWIKDGCPARTTIGRAFLRSLTPEQKADYKDNKPDAKTEFRNKYAALQLAKFRESKSQSQSHRHVDVSKTLPLF